MTNLPAGEQTKFVSELILNCPLCACTSSSKFALASDLLHGVTSTSFQYVTCAACGVIYQENRPTEQTIGVFYNKDYAPYGQKRAVSSFSKKIRRRALKWADWYVGNNRVSEKVKAIHHSKLRAGKVLLDFGCGGGKRLDSYRRTFDCQTIGMDFNEAVLQVVADRGHLALPSTPVGWSQVQSASVDLVIMSHVVEHLHRPKEVLSELFRALKPGGKLDLTTPNPEGISARTFGSNWFGLEAPRHVILFPPNVLIAMLQAVGFAEVTLLGEPVCKDYVRSSAQARTGSFDASAAIAAFEIASIALKIKAEARRGNFDRYHLIATKAA